MKCLRLFAAALVLCASGIARASVYPAGSPHSTENDDTCDIALLPAATLLLPYFEVDLNSGGKTTLFTLMNVSPAGRIAHVTIWTDHHVPLLTLDVSLAPYDTRSINLYDVIALGRVESCDGPETLPAEVLLRLREAFLQGRMQSGSGVCQGISGRGPNAAGFVTVDVVGSCTALTPEDRAYYTEAIAFDNVLTGDYQHIDVAERRAEGGALVHIRAIPEGGTALTRRFDLRLRTNFPSTFYGRFQNPAHPKLDGRQPLPTTLVAAWEEQPLNGVGTEWTIWHGGRSEDTRSCNGRPVDDQARILLREVVRFDDQENAVGESPEQAPCTCPVHGPSTRAAGRYPNDHFLEIYWDDMTAGWLYLNFGRENADPPGQQAWVVATRTAGRMTSARDAVALGNGCSRGVPESEISDGHHTLGPAPNVNP